MRDIVTRDTGTFFTGLTALPVIKTTQTATSVDLEAYNGCTIYILANTWTDGTLTPVIEESDASGSGFATVANGDLVAWSATSATDFTPVRVGGAQPTAISSAATAINWRIGYNGAKRYVRVTTTVTGSPATGCGFDIIIQAGDARFKPPLV